MGSGNGEFNQIVGIATDNSNNVYVTDKYNLRVEKFTSDGDFVKSWGSDCQYFVPSHKVLPLILQIMYMLLNIMLEESPSLLVMAILSWAGRCRHHMVLPLIV